MYILSPKNHETANKFWKEKLGGRPNGARTLGTATEKYLAKEFEKHYDMLITYAIDFPFTIPEGVKTIAVMWHANFPWTEGFKLWQKSTIKLAGYEVDYFVNEHRMVDLINEVGGRAFFLPRFIDTTTLPAIPKEKKIKTLWYGNRWNEFEGEFGKYLVDNEEPYWVSQGKFGLGNDVIYEKLDHKQSLDILKYAEKVWAIGLSQLEAKALGAEVVSYRGPTIPLYTQKTAPVYLRRLLDEIWSKRNPTLGK